MDAAHAEGMRVYVWTLNNREDMLAAIEMNVDGIITDDPALLKEIIEAGS